MSDQPPTLPPTPPTTPQRPPPPPPPAFLTDQIKANTVQDLDVAFPQINLDDLPSFPSEQEQPLGVKIQIADAAAKGIGEHDPEHPHKDPAQADGSVPEHQRVPTTLPAEIWQFPQYEGVDFVASNQLSNLNPPSMYDVNFIPVPNEEHPEASLTYVSLSFISTPESSPRDRLLKNGGLFEVTYQRTVEYLVGRGGFGNVFMGIAMFFTPDVPADTSRIDISQHTKERLIVVKEIAFCDRPENRTHNFRDTQPINQSFTIHDNSTPYDFTVAMLCRHIHICTVYDYTVFNYAPTAEGGGEKLWAGFMEFLRGGDLSTYFKRWRDFMILANEVHEGNPLNEDQQHEVMNICNNQTEAYAKWGAIPEVVMRGFTQQLYEAVFYLHRLGIAHLDLKPANIMFDLHGTLKLVDFGLSHPVRSVTKEEVWALAWGGTAGFMAPEVMRVRRAMEVHDHQNKYSLEATKADLYSLAVIVFICIFGTLPIPVLKKTDYEMRDGQQVPFQKLDVDAMLELTEMGATDGETYWKQYIDASQATHPISVQLLNFLFKGLSPDPNGRLTAYMALADPQDSWLAPGTRGLDALHDYRMRHGTIVPK